MRKIAIALVTVAVLMIVGCQPPEGMIGVTPEQLEEVKTEIQALRTEIADLQAALEEFTEVYNEHVEKYHKGGTHAPAPPKPPPVQK